MCYEQFRTELKDLKEKQAREELTKETPAPNLEREKVAIPALPREEWESEIEPAFSAF